MIRLNLLFHIRSLITSGKYPFQSLFIFFKIKRSDFSIEKIENFKRSRGRKMVDYAVAHVPFYIKLHESKSRESILNDYVTDKEELRKNTNSFYDKTKASYNIGYTSGSSGSPVEIHVSKTAEAWRNANRMRFFSWYNLRIYDNNVQIGGHTIKNNLSRKKIFINKLKGCVYINVFNLSSLTVHLYYSEIQKLNPLYIRGIKSGLYQLAKLLESNNLQVNLPRLKICVVTCEVLRDEEREFMHHIFKVPIINEYGAVDSGLIAYECPCGSLHINEESLLVKCLDGEAVISEYANIAMPLINYRNGDRIKFSSKKCSCGRKTAVIESIEGRTSDSIMKENGELLNWSYFHFLIKDINKNKKEIYSYKIEQEQFKFIFYIVPVANWDQDLTISLIRKSMFVNIGSSISIDFRIVRELPLEKSGKLRDFRRIQ